MSMQPVNDGSEIQMWQPDSRAHTLDRTCSCGIPESMGTDEHVG